MEALKLTAYFLEVTNRSFLFVNKRKQAYTIKINGEIFCFSLNTTLLALKKNKRWISIYYCRIVILSPLWPLPSKHRNVNMLDECVSCEKTTIVVVISRNFLLLWWLQKLFFPLQTDSDGRKAKEESIKLWKRLVFFFHIPIQSPRTGESNFHTELIVLVGIWTGFISTF